MSAPFFGAVPSAIVGTREEEPLMRVARFYAPEDVRLEESEEPSPAADEVKIRVRNCSTCGTDVKIFHNGHPNMTPPRVMGHEVAGEVVEVGQDIDGWAAGDSGAGDRGGARRDVRGVPSGRMTVCTNQTSIGYLYDGASPTT
jgi:L-iditol 2-dehydrogenase